MSDKPFPPISDETIAELRDFRLRDEREKVLGLLDDLERKANAMSYRRSEQRFVGVRDADLLYLVAIVRSAHRWQRQITALSVSSGLPSKVWSELCLLDSEMAAALAKITP